jgi:hypothetical protein
MDRSRKNRASPAIHAYTKISKKPLHTIVRPVMKNTVRGVQRFIKYISKPEITILLI